MVSPVYESHELTYLPKAGSNSSGIHSETRSSSSTMMGLDVSGNSNFFRFRDENCTKEYIHSGRVNEVMNALRYVLLLLGRFPFRPTIEVQASESCPLHSSVLVGENTTTFFKGKNYSTSLKTFSWAYFGVTSLLLIFMLVISMSSFLGVFLEWNFLNFPNWDCNQTRIFGSNLIPFVLVWSCLLSSTVGNFSFLLNRRNFVKFLNYWNVAVDELDVKVPNRTKRFLHMSNLWFLAFSILAVISTKILSIKLAKGGSTLLGILALRTFIPKIHEMEWLCRTLGMFIMLYAIYASRALLFLFVFKCKLLRHCFKEWNLRLATELKRPKQIDSDDVLKEEASCKKIFFQWTILLKLVRLTDKVFAAVLLAYYGSQILNMCFELYYVAMSNTDTIFNRDEEVQSWKICPNNSTLSSVESDGDDGLDTFVSILLLIQNVYVFLSVSLNAAYVGEEANKSFEILKTKGISMHDSVYRRHLIQSLQISFHQKVCLTGGHYFEIQKSFIVTVMGAVFTYFIIILQYGHRLAPANNNSTTY